MLAAWTHSWRHSWPFWGPSSSPPRGNSIHVAQMINDQVAVGAFTSTCKKYGHSAIELCPLLLSLFRIIFVFKTLFTTNTFYSYGQVQHH